MRKNTEKDFWDRVIVRGDNECWGWSGPKMLDGRGQMSFGNRTMTAPNIMLTISAGKSDQHALHTCDNPECVNPRHLYWGSPKDNARDMVDRNRMNLYERSGRISGSKNPMSKLNEDQVDYIRNELRNGAVGRMLAVQFDVSPATISLIKSGKNWPGRKEVRG